jgi:hypothetical protein
MWIGNLLLIGLCGKYYTVSIVVSKIVSHINEMKK